MKGKIYIFITALLIGVCLGYFWRMIQIEPQLENEISLTTQIQKRIYKDIYYLELKISILESKVDGLLRKRGKL